MTTDDMTEEFIGEEKIKEILIESEDISKINPIEVTGIDDEIVSEYGSRLTNMSHK